MPKMQNKKSFLVRFLKVSPVLLFAVAGAYMVFGAGAETYRGFEFSMGFAQSEADNSQEIVAIKTSGSMRNTTTDAHYQANVAFFSDDSRVEYVSYSCHPKLICVDSNWRGYSSHSSKHMDAKVTDLVLCITAAPGFQLAGVEFITLNYRIKDHTRPYWLQLTEAVGPGSCESNPSATGVTEKGSNGVCINVYLNPNYGCKGTGGLGTDRSLGKNPYTNTSTTTLNEGTKQTYQGADLAANGTGGAGSNGASATTQADIANSIPSSSGQGLTTEQPKLEPSPFFDGKDYALGSDPIDKAFGNLSIGGKRIIHGWLYLLGVFFIIGNLVAGYFLWWKRLSEEEQSRWKARLHFRT